MSITDDALDRYFTDSTIEGAVGRDVRGFLKTQETLDRYKSILVKLVGAVASRNGETLNLMANVLSQLDNER